MQQNSTSSSPATISLCPWHWGWAAGLALLVLFTLAFRYALPVRDGDLWWHILYGQYFLEHKTLIADHTIFSWTPATNDTIYCTWLPDIFLYLLHKVAGLPGIFAFRYLCMLVPVLGCLLFARRLKIASHPLTWLLCLLAVSMSFTAAFERPEILSYVFMTVIVWNWWHIRATGEGAWRRCYLFPLVMLVWINSHGGFVFGAAFLLLIALGELLNTWLSPNNVLSPQLRKHLFIALLLAAFTALLTPYGYRYPLQLLFDFLPTESNMNYNKKILAYGAPFDFPDIFLLALGANMVIALLLLLYLRNIKRAEWSSLLTNLFFAFLYTRFFRTTFFWVPVFLFSSIHLLSLSPLVVPGWRYGKFMSRLLPALSSCLALLFAGKVLYNAYYLPELGHWMGFGIGDLNPVTEAEYIKKHYPLARIGNTYNQGSYLLWRLWPQNKIFFDSRHFPFRHWSDEFFSFSYSNNVEMMLEKYPCDLWCVSTAIPQLPLQLLQTGDWRLAFYGRNAAVLVRKEIPLPTDCPRASPDITAHKNIYNALESIKFSCSIMDLKSANAILDTIRRTHAFSPQQATIRYATHIYEGTLAYSQDDYAEVARQFSLLQNPPEHIRFMLASSYHQLCATAWRQREGSLALDYARKAWQLEPESPHALFNLGALLWYKHHLNTEPINEAMGWRPLLQGFLRVAPEGDFDTFRPLAQSMLAGTHSASPPVLLHPKPPPFWETAP